MPRICTATTMMMTSSTIRTALTTQYLSDGSIFDAALSFFSFFVRKWTARNPTTSRSKAQTNRTANPAR